MRNLTTHQRRRFFKLKLNNLKFLMLNEGRSGLRQFEMSGRTALRCLIGLIILIPIFFYLGSHLLLETAYSHRIAKLRKDNVDLQNLVEQFEDRITDLQQEVAVLSEMDQNLRIQAEIPGINSDIRQVGIGGTMVEVSTDMDYLLSSKDISLASITERLNSLQRSVNLEQLSYEAIRDSIKNELSRLNVTPSIYPVVSGDITSGFGWRIHPITGEWETHQGVDIGVRSGTPVYSTADGRVITARWDTNLGTYIKINHGNGVYTVYGHLNQIDVGEGQWVTAGQQIGESGNSGRTTSPHLHYEVRVYNQAQNPINYFYY